MSVTAVARQASDTNFRLYYQPIESSDTQKLWGFEVLSGLEDDFGGTGPAASAKEQKVAVTSAAFRVLRQACREVADWQYEHPSARDLHVAVNLAAPLLGWPDLAPSIWNMLDREQLHPTTLCLEIPERAIAALDRHGRTNLGLLQDLGVQITVDGFGGDPGLIGDLPTVPVDNIKLHPSLVHELPDSTSVVAAAVKMAHDNGVRVIADGLELGFQRAQVVNLGCDLAQGYLIGVANPPEVVSQHFSPAAFPTASCS